MEFHLVLYRRVNLIPLEIFTCLLKRKKDMSIKDEARPNSLKTNENKSVLILDSYYNSTNLNLQKKNPFEREHFTEVSVKFRRKSSSLSSVSFKRTLADNNIQKISVVHALLHFSQTCKIAFFAAINHNYDHKQRTLKHRNTQNGSKSTNHKSQTLTF